jgi:sterol 3beta-glucosyltransferase
MSNQGAARTTEAIVEALRACGQRAVLLIRWGGIGAANLPDGVLEIDQAPYDWLFPRVRRGSPRGRRYGRSRCAGRRA